MSKEEKMKRAVALKYEPQKVTAPKVVAKGQGKLAEKIVEVAKRYNIHVHQDRDLADILYKLELLEEIPPHLYSVVAEIFCFLYERNKEVKAAQKGS